VFVYGNAPSMSQVLAGSVKAFRPDTGVPHISVSMRVAEKAASRRIVYTQPHGLYGTRTSLPVPMSNFEDTWPLTRPSSMPYRFSDMAV
jgi:hypothetical protein